MATIAGVDYNNFIIEKKETESIVLATAAAIYTQGMVVVLGNDGKYRNDLIINPEDTPAGTNLPFSEQKIYILSVDVDATVADQTTVGYTGSFNRAAIAYLAPQVETDVKGTLQAKNIILKDWSVE